MAGPFRSRIVSASVEVAGKLKESAPKPDTMALVNGKRTDADEATYNARSCPLFAAGGYLTSLIEFSATTTRVDHCLGRVPEGAIVAILMDEPVQLYVYNTTALPMTSQSIIVGNDSGLTCRARFWIF